MTFRLFILQLTSSISALKHSPSRKGRKDISFKRTVQSHQRTVSITNETDQQATLSSTSAPAAAVADADAEEETALASADKLETTTATATSNEDPSTNDGKNTIFVFLGHIISFHRSVFFNVYVLLLKYLYSRIEIF